MRGLRAAAARRRGVATTPVTKGAASSGTGASATGGRGPRRAPASRAPGRCSPWSGELTLPAPVVTAWPEHLLVLDPGGSTPWRSPGRPGSLCPAPAPLCAGGLQLRAPRWRGPSVCFGYQGGARGTSLLRLRIRRWWRRQRDPWCRGGLLRCKSSTRRRQVVFRGHLESNI
jgi:hypothetical protein